MSSKNAYLESQVMTADRLELVRMLYQAAIDSIRDARMHLIAGDIATRAKCVTRAQAIIEELSASLDPSAGEITQNLASLYDYARQQLTKGNLLQQDAPLGEAEGVLTTLHEAWQAMSAQEPVGAAFPTSPAMAWAGRSYSDAHTWSA